MVAVSFDLDAAGTLHRPSLLLFELALLVEAGYVGSILGRSAVGHRGAGVVDELTGLLNRTALRARLLELDAHQATVRHPVGMLLIDVDNFKQINDREGHAVGDLVLREGRRSSFCSPRRMPARRRTSVSGCGRRLAVRPAGRSG
jgi:hypothetical protein